MGTPRPPAKMNVGDAREGVEVVGVQHLMAREGVIEGSTSALVCARAWVAGMVWVVILKKSSSLGILAGGRLCLGRRYDSGVVDLVD